MVHSVIMITCRVSEVSVRILLFYLCLFAVSIFPCVRVLRGAARFFAAALSSCVLPSPSSLFLSSLLLPLVSHQ